MLTGNALSYLDLYSAMSSTPEPRGGGHQGAKADARAGRADPQDPTERLPRDRSLVPRPGTLVPLGKPEPVEDKPDASEVRRKKALEIAGVEADVRNISPRDVTALGFELYASGALAYDEYAELAFQPELHPDYNTTIGALIGEKATPDKPRDFVRIWEERLAFEQRYNPGDVPRVKQSQRIVTVLRRLGGADAASA